MKRLIWGVLIFLGMVSVQAHGANLQAGSKIYITPMEGGLENFISAEMLKQKVPVQITSVENKADYIITGSSVKKDGSNKWYHYLTGTAGTTDSMQTSLSLFSRKDRTLIWASSAGDRSIFWGMLKKKGERKVAQRIVKQFKHDLF